ncbi:hypothetical protein O1611_g2646 [Lasiodiplodia mahajangana]|uniref:Uncharacterized protein n=1 Tax=Lasiodiplodia mahajangana TaxID=1108764 RepID=A0ACC2JUB6_9PEZI|nr:hypothetical protein O1611_g2646 [Lasiodiplodia mahajangana]
MGMSELVPSESAILHGYPAIGIQASHRCIARFASADDLGSFSVLGELRRWTGQVAFSGAAGNKEVERKRGSNALRGWTNRKGAYGEDRGPNPY